MLYLSEEPEEEVVEDKPTVTSNTEESVEKNDADQTFDKSEAEPPVASDLQNTEAKMECGVAEKTIEQKSDEGKSVKDETVKSDSVICESDNVENKDKSSEKEAGNAKSDLDSSQVNEKTDESNETKEAEVAKSEEKKAEPKPVRWTMNKIKSEWRRFNLDLSPKVIDVIQR